MQGILSAPFAELLEFQLTLVSLLFGLASVVIYPFAFLALKFCERFLFCCHMFIYAEFIEV